MAEHHPGDRQREAVSAGRDRPAAGPPAAVARVRLVDEHARPRADTASGDHRLPQQRGEQRLPLLSARPRRRLRAPLSVHRVHPVQRPARQHRRQRRPRRLAASPRIRLAHGEWADRRQTRTLEHRSIMTPSPDTIHPVNRPRAAQTAGATAQEVSTPMRSADYRLIRVRAPGDISHWALVDPEDHARFAAYSWSLSDGYARRYGPRPAKLVVYMAREILGLAHGDPRQADHINRDRLDNRRSNLRVVTSAQNNRNVGANARTTSPHRGVSRDGHRGKWRAQATLAGAGHNLGRYVDETAAARAVNDFWTERGYPAPNDV
jgi:hypothetical protein